MEVDGGEVRTGRCVARKKNGEGEELEGGSTVLFIRRQGNRQARKTRRPNDGYPANWMPQFSGRH